MKAEGDRSRDVEALLVAAAVFLTGAVFAGLTLLGLAGLKPATRSAA